MNKFVKSITTPNSFIKYMNTTIQPQTSQQETNNHPIISPFVATLQDLIPSQFHFVSELMQVAANNINSPLFPSQTSLGLWGNPEGKEYSRETMNRSAKYLASRGLITKRYRYKQTCVYTLHPLFMSPEARPLLLPLIPAIRKLPTFQFCATLLFSLLAPNVTQLEVSNYPLRGRVITSFSLRNTRSQSENLTTKKIVSDQQFESGIKILKAMGLTPPENIYELKKRQEEQMHQQQGKQIEAQPISKAILAIKSLKLTKWGQIKLSIFTDYAISYADSVNLSAPAAPDPFQNFFSIAQRVSIERKLPINTVTFMELARKYSMPQDAQYIIKAKPVEFAPSRNGEVIYSTESSTFQKTKAWTKPVREAHDPLKEIQTMDTWCSSQDGLEFKRKFGVDPARYLAVCAQNNAENWDSQANAPVAEDLAYKERRRKSQEKLSERIRNAKELASNF